MNRLSDGFVVAGEGAARDLMIPAYDAMYRLKDLAMRESWTELARASAEAGGLALAALTSLARDRENGARTRRELDALSDEVRASAANFVADRAQRRALAEAVRAGDEPLEGMSSEDRERLLDALDGRGGSEAARAFDLGASIEEPGLNLQHEQDAFVALAVRSLQAAMHVRFNQAYWGAADEDLREGADETALSESVDAFQRTVSNAVKEVYQAALAGDSRAIRESAAVAALRMSSALPDFARTLAVFRHGARRLRMRGQGGRAERLGLRLARGGRATREALAAHAAALTAAFGEWGGELESLIRKASAAPFETRAPDGRNVELSRMGELQDEEYVEARGFVSRLKMIKTGDRKLVSLIELWDPSSESHGALAATFFHARHRGVSKGSYVVASGRFRSESVLRFRKPTIEIERLSLSALARDSWRVGFLRSARSVYECWPGGLNMSWSLAGHRVERASGEARHQGAGELVYPPFVR